MNTTLGNTKFIALLRGINVGKSIRVNMKELKLIFEDLGFCNVSTYINSGNVLFESSKEKSEITATIKNSLKQKYGQNIPVLIKSLQEMQVIAEAIPEDWQNNSTHKTDVAYLFPENDSEETIDTLKIDKDFIKIGYANGAIFWNVSLEDYNKSKLNKIIGQKSYKLMTVRNVNTARFLAGKLAKTESTPGNQELVHISE